MRNRHGVLATVSALALSAWTQPLSAQTVASPPAAAEAPQPDAQDTGLQDIIVTAERRSTSVQKTPLTIQVLSSESLNQSGVTAPASLTAALPSVQIGKSGPATSVYVRGVGGFQSIASSNPAVPYYIDDVYVARTQSVVSEFYDVDRLELLKGPQGTLYGRNASGGAINILTRKPELGMTEVRGRVEIGDYGNQNGELAVNLPIGRTLALRVSGTIVDKGGYTSEGFGSDKHYGVRAKLLWEPSSTVSLLLNGSYGKIYGGGTGVVTLNRDIAGWYPWLDATDPRSQAYFYATGVAPAPFVRASQPSDVYNDLRFYNLSAQLNVDLGFAKLTVIPAYRDTSMSYGTGLGFALNIGGAVGDIRPRPQTSKATSVEARLSGDVGPLSYVAGLFFDNEDQYEQFSINGGFIQTIGQITTLNTRSYAAFGQATLKVADHVRLIGGLRYTADRRSLDAQTYLISPAAFLGAPPPQGLPCTFPAPTQPKCLVDQSTGNKTYRNISFKAGAEADVFANSLLYATVSRGFKAGGFNVQSALGTPGKALEIQPEKLTSYEVGLKNRFLDNALQVNLSGFYWDYKNHQEPVLTYTNVPGITNLVFRNAGAIEIYGGTLDVVARPWTGGTISTGVEYAHSRYVTFDKAIPIFAYSAASTGCRAGAPNPVAGTITLDCSGFEVSRTPKWSGSVELNQAVDLGRGKLIGDAKLTFASKRYLGTDFVPIERVHAYGLLDLALTYEAPGKHWSLTGFVRNVTNGAAYTEASLNPFSRFVYADIQPPRSYGASLSFNF